MGGVSVDFGHLAGSTSFDVFSDEGFHVGPHNLAICRQYICEIPCAVLPLPL